MSNYEELAYQCGFEIHDHSLYDLAFTHPSYNADARTKHQDYERLEYMGDAVLGFVSADLIFNLHPKMNQGLMTKLRSYLVKTKSLADYARMISLADYIKTGHSIERNKINESNKILEDVFEAFIGAIYLDNGIEVAYRFIESFLRDDVINTSLDVLTDYKTKLQEEMQAEHRDSVKYVLTKTYGPPHDRTFEVDVTFNDIVLASGVGKTKKAAEEEAAKKALSKRRV